MKVVAHSSFIVQHVCASLRWGLGPCWWLRQATTGAERSAGCFFSGRLDGESLERMGTGDGGGVSQTLFPTSPLLRASSALWFPPKQSKTCDSLSILTFVYRLQEVDVVARTHVAFWGVGHLIGPRAVAASGLHVAVCEDWDGAEDGVHRVSVFHATTRELLYVCSAAAELESPRGLCFSQGNTCLVVADAVTSRLCGFHAADGTLAWHLDLGTREPLDVVPCVGGFLVADYSDHSVARIDGTSGSCTGFLSDLQAPSSLALVRGLGLVVREHTSARLQVFVEAV